MTNDNGQLESWLERAHAMEEGLIPILEAHSEDAKGQPDIVAKIKEHLEKTKHHSKLVAERLKELGTKASRTKEAIAQGMGKIGGVTTGNSGEKLIKNAISDYSAEHMEIATYQAIKAMAEEMDDEDTVQMCEEIIPDEEEMALWLEENLPELVKSVAEE